MWDVNQFNKFLKVNFLLTPNKPQKTTGESIFFDKIKPDMKKIIKYTC